MIAEIMATDIKGPLTKREAGALIRRRHPEWRENQKRWRWLEDSLEGGNRYRHADYTIDPTSVEPGSIQWYMVTNRGYDPATSESFDISYNQIVDRNLVPHLSEMSPDGRDLYTLRLHRTPIPTNLSRSIRSHLSRIYSHAIDREGPDDLLRWWNDVDGSGQNIDRWMRESVAPLFLALGQIDLVFDHPREPEGVEVLTVADQQTYGLDTCVAGIVLPENMLWWKLDPRSKLYTECLVFERGDDEVRYRHWTEEGCYVYDPHGEFDADESYDYDYGRVPIVRIFDTRKVRCGNVGQSRYEAVAEYQKAVYNGLSELILGDCEQSHAKLSGPEDFLQKGATIPIGPGNVLPKKKNVHGNSVSYEGFEFIEPPKGAQAAVRQHILDFNDYADREAALLKPAGMTSGSTVAQSGISKAVDNQELNAFIGEEATALQDLEVAVASMVLTVLGNEQPAESDIKSVTITYPRQFDLFSVGELAATIQDLQGIVALTGMLPETETELIQRMMQIALPGLKDDKQQLIRDEIEAFVKGRAIMRQVPKEGENEVQGIGPDAEPVTTVVQGPEGLILESPPA